MNGSRRLSSQEIAEALRERIRQGDLKAGDRLPTQAELADEFSVERGAVRQALRALQEDGLLSNVSKGSPPRIAEPAGCRRSPGTRAFCCRSRTRSPESRPNATTSTYL